MKIPEDFVCVHNENEIKGFFKGYRFLSNMFPCEVDIYNHKFKSSEHAYQWAKSIDVGINPCVVDALSPTEVKQWGKTFKLRNNWNMYKESVMMDCVYTKFYNNDTLQKLLLETGNAYLEELNWWRDSEWGVDCKTGKGENKLGNILMNVRKMLRINAL